MDENNLLQKIKSVLNGKCLTSKLLIDELLKMGCFLNRDTARNRIFRLLEKNKLISSKPIEFLDQGFIIAFTQTSLDEYCLSMIRNNYDVFDSVFSILEENGEISYFELEKIFLLERNNLSARKKIIKCIDFLYKIEVDNINNKLKSKYKKIFDESYLAFKEVLPSIAINYFTDLNLLFGNKIEFRQKTFIPKQLFNVSFDMYTTSNLLSFRRKMSYFVFDIACSLNYTKGEYLAFKNRINKVFEKSKIDIIPFIICGHISDELLLDARKHKIAVYKMSNLFGEKYSDYFSLFYKIKKQELPLNEFERLLENLKLISMLEYCKGYLFEYLCQLIIKKAVNDDILNIEKDVKIFDKGKCTAQFDIVFKTKNAICLCECKSSKYCISLGKPHTKNTVSYFVSQVEKYESKYHCNAKILFFSAKGYKKNITDDTFIEKSYKLLSHFGNDKACLNKFDIKLVVPQLYNIWNKYF